ncbi:MAG TPA: adenylate/guanylate cyclase domain-containing protein [Ktedonobacterales bacterium]|jgi:class 3 adenylate cyclase/predicted ATPase
MPEERKLVTILFADVTGSTSLGESLDPEDFRALMGRYYEHAREIISRHSGTLEKFIGDAVMAVFGLPAAHEDDAERALAAALALREVIRQDALLGESFQLRMGVNTGEVMATTDASRSDFLVTGDAVNAAARLQQNANPGEIIASERTAQAARMAFVFEEPREIQVKGKQLPLRVFPLKEKRTVRLVERPPLVGRKQDLLQLEILREHALEDERPQFASIIAPAGTGKTRLLEEFLSRLDPEEGFQVAAARCQPYGETMAYLPLQSLLQELLGAEVSRERAVDSFTQGGYRADDSARLAGHVLATLGREGESGASADRELIFSAWRLLIEALARQAPRIIIIENLHWASDSLLDLVEHISSLRTQVSLLLIVLSRPELLDRRPNWGGGRQNFTSLALQPLSAKRSRELVKRLAPDLPEAVSAKIAESCGGNPFFAQELVRGLAERGLVGTAATTDALPDTVHAAVLARLDLLSKAEREVLQVASVAGRSFTPTLVKSVLPTLSADEIEAALNGLLARDMVATAAGGVFTFHHGLMLDVTYGTLSRAERIRLHKAIAASLLEEANDHLDECVELLAYHYHKAVELSRLSAVPQKLEVETERAIKFQVRAGELASRAGAFGEALAYFEHALQLAGDAEKITLYEQLGDSLAIPWKIKIHEAYQRALDLWRALPDRQPLAGARLIRKLLITKMRWHVADSLSKEEAEALWQEGIQLAELAGDEEELWRVRTAPLFMQDDFRELGVEEMRQSKQVQALKQVAVEAADHFEQRQDWNALSEILDGYSVLQFRSGENTEARNTIERRLQLANLSFSERADAISSFNAIALLSGDYDAGIQMMIKTLESLHPGEPLEAFAHALNGPIWSLYFTARWSEAPRFRQALDEIWRHTHDIEGDQRVLLGSYLALLVMALAREDQAEIKTIEEILRQIQPDWRDVPVLPFVAFYRDGDFSQFQVSSRGDDLAGALIMLFTEHEQNPPDEVLKQGDYFADDLTLRASAIASALRANENAALAQAIDEAEAHQLIVHAARMRIILAKHTGDLSQLERSRVVLEPLEDRLFLHKLREVEQMLLS